MKLSQIIEYKQEEEELSNVTRKDYNLWLRTLKDMVEEEGIEFEEALDYMLDNDPKFEMLKPAQQKKVVRNIRDMFDREAAK